MGAHLRGGLIVRQGGEIEGAGAHFGDGGFPRWSVGPSPTLAPTLVLCAPCAVPTAAGPPTQPIPTALSQAVSPAATAPEATPQRTSILTTPALVATSAAVVRLPRKRADDASSKGSISSTVPGSGGGGRHGSSRKTQSR